MKKILSLLLSFALILTSIISINLSALANDNTEYEKFNIQEFFDNYQNKADNFNYLQYVSQYYTSEEVKNTIEFRINQDTNCYNLVDYLENDFWFKSSYAIWEASTFITNPSEIVGRQLNKETYYETIILRILNSAVTSDNAIDWLNQGAIKNSIKISKHITQISETEYYAYLTNMRIPISDFTNEEYDKTIEFTKNYINSQGYKKFGKDVSFLSDVLSMSKDIEEYSEKLASYCQLIELGEAVADFLEEVKNNSDDKDLIKAIDNVIPIINDSYSDMLKTAAKDGLYCIGSSALKKIVGDTWKTCLVNLLNSGYLFDGTAIVGSVFLAIGVTKTFTNIAFSVDAKLDKYELMKALCSFEQSMEAAIYKKINTFEDTDEYANLLLEGVSVVYHTYIVDTEIYSEMTRICQNDWIGNLSKDKYEEVLQICKYNKELYQNEYDSLKILSGVCGDALGWVITFDNELLIYGVGEMYDFEKEKAPWYAYKDRFNSLYISKFTTVLGGYAFYNCNNIINDLYLDHSITIRWNCFDHVSSNMTLISKEDLLFFGCQHINYKIICNGKMKFSVLNDEDFVINNVVKVAGDLTCNFDRAFKDGVIGTGENCAKLVVNSKLLVLGSCMLNTDNRGSILSLRGYHDLQINPGGEVIVDKNLTMVGRPSSEENYHTRTYMRLYVKGNLTVSNDIDLYQYSEFNIDDENAKVVVKNDFNKGSIYADLNANKGELHIYGTPNGVAYNYNGDANWYLYGKEIKKLTSSYTSGMEEGHGSITFCGTVEQRVNTAIDVTNLIITNKSGVIFTATVKVHKLFNHDGNPFILYNNGEGSSFPDYDGDGYKDHVDPYPLVKHPDEHDYVFTKTVAPTCTAQGYDLYTCSNCNGTEKRNIVSSTGHSYEVTSNTATCTEAGIKISVCSKCGDKKEENVSALGHTYSKVYTAPTCTEANGYTNTCTRCGDITYDFYAAKGHDYGEIIGEDYISKIADSSISQNPNYFNEFYHTSSSIGSTSNIFLLSTNMAVPNEIRLDINNMEVVSDYPFAIKGALLQNKNCNGIFAYDINTGRSPEQSAIPHTDKDGNLVNMHYVDFKTNSEWVSGEYQINDNKIIDASGNIVCDNFTETRPHIVYTKSEALEKGIMNRDGTVNVNTDLIELYGVSFSAGISGVYFTTTTIVPTSSRQMIDVFGFDKNMQGQIKGGVFDVNLCFYNPTVSGLSKTTFKIYDGSLINRIPATLAEDERIEYTCMDCGEIHVETCALNLAEFKIAAASISLASNIRMNYKVLKTAVTDFENPYIEVTRNGKTVKITEYSEQGDYYVFSYRNIAPQCMGDPLTAVLHGTHNGILYNSAALDFSVKEYAYRMLQVCEPEQYSSLRTLLVDMLNYGSEAQIYMNYNTDNLVNADLTEQQKSWASNDALSLTNIANPNYKEIENASVVWKGAGLSLYDSISVRYTFTSDNIDNLTLKVTCNNRIWTYSKDDIIDNGNGTYSVLFDNLNADQMSDEIYITAYKSDIEASNTLCYSVESYTALVHSSMPSSALEDLTRAMIKYGTSAKAYAK